MITVDFFLGLGSRYSYLAASQIDRIEIQTGCRFIWKPIASGLLIDRRRANPFRDSQGAGPYNQGYRIYDAEGWATYYGIPFREPAALAVGSAVSALACLAAGEQGRLIACCRLLQQLIFVEGATIGADAIASLPARLRAGRGAIPPRSRGAQDAGAARGADRRGRAPWRLRHPDVLRRPTDVRGERSPAASRSGVARHGAAALETIDRGARPDGP